MKYNVVVRSFMDEGWEAPGSFVQDITVGDFE